MESIIPDTSVIIDSRFREYIEESTEKIRVIIPNAVLAEFEHQAKNGRELGLDGLYELNQLRELSKSGVISLEYRGERPSYVKGEIKNDVLNEIVRDTAVTVEGTLVTSNEVQHLAAKAHGIDVIYLERKPVLSQPQVLDLFDDKTMSVHIKENIPIFAKKGDVGSFELVNIASEVSREQAEEYAKQLTEYAHIHPNGFIEDQREGATILQVQDYRIVVTRPPFSDGIEITLVKPIVKTILEDYNLSDKLLDRLDCQAEGILVSGSPGQGKSTFAQALAEYYRSKNKIVKTMEHPRDLQVSGYITQYGPLEGSMEDASDVLLLVRPDYTIFDEVRKTSDFKVLSDMRLAGVGMVGVTHSSKAIDSVQRLIGRVELGMIPHIIDTVIHINKGLIEKVYELAISVKVPHGMTERDLSRPVLQIRDYESGNPEYEMYSFGDEVVVVPIGKPLSFRQSTKELTISRTKKFIILRSLDHINKYVEIYVADKLITTGKINRYGTYRLRRNSHEGRMIADAMSRGDKISIK